MKTLVKNLLEGAFEAILSGFSALGQFAGKAKEIKVSVKVNNLVERKDPLKQVSGYAENIFNDRFEEKKRCQLDGPVNTVDLQFTITASEGKLIFTVKSDYLQKNTAASPEIKEAFEQFITDANEVIDELLGIHLHELSIDLNSMSKTHQFIKLNQFFEEKLSRIFFAVLVKKFITEISK